MCLQKRNNTKPLTKPVGLSRDRAVASVSVARARAFVLQTDNPSIAMSQTSAKYGAVPLDENTPLVKRATQRRAPSLRSIVIAASAVFLGAFFIFLPTSGREIEYDSPRWWMRVELDDGRVLSGRAYARLVSQALADSASSAEQPFALNVSDVTSNDSDEFQLGNKASDGQVFDEASVVKYLRRRIEADASTMSSYANYSATLRSQSTQATLGRTLSRQERLENAYGGYKASKSYSDLKNTDDLSSTFCWKDTYGRGVGEFPSSCPSDKETRLGGMLCYLKCDRFGNYERFGVDCHQNCNHGWSNQGAFCNRASDSDYGRGVGTIPHISCKWYGWNPIPKCKSPKCPSSRRDNCLGLCYPPCKSGYDRFGCNICTRNCKAQGYASGVGPSCPRQMVLSTDTAMRTEWAVCKSSQEQDGALCYDKCASGYDGVGPLCWGRAPRGWVNCGFGAAKTSGDCVSTVMDQVTGPGEIALFVASYGSSGAASKASKLNTIRGAMKKNNADDPDKVSKVFTAIGKFFEAMSKKASRSKNEIQKTAKANFDNIITYIDAQSTFGSAILTLVGASSEVDILRGVAEIMSLLDPTGVASTVAAYAHPNCADVDP